MFGYGTALGTVRDPVSYPTTTRVATSPTPTTTRATTTTSSTMATRTVSPSPTTAARTGVSLVPTTTRLVPPAVITPSFNPVLTPTPLPQSVTPTPRGGGATVLQFPGLLTGGGVPEDAPVDTGEGDGEKKGMSPVVIGLIVVGAAGLLYMLTRPAAATPNRRRRRRKKK